MAQQQNELAGILFPNDKGDKPARPDYRGAATIGGTAYRISGWAKKGKNGKFMSLAFTIDERYEQTALDDDNDDDLPF